MIGACYQRRNQGTNKLFLGLPFRSTKNVRERLFEQEHQKQANEKQTVGGAAAINIAGKTRLRSFLDDDGDNLGSAEQRSEDLGYAGAPIADLFPDCTVLFSDIAGFTAWSSVRERTFIVVCAMRVVVFSPFSFSVAL